jgi:hypothetical protein
MRCEQGIPNLMASPICCAAGPASIQEMRARKFRCWKGAVAKQFQFAEFIYVFYRYRMDILISLCFDQNGTLRI